MNNTDRIISIDVLRGVAVLGILIMNIQSFSMPAAAYINPAAYGNLEGLNKWVWILSHILASEKFMSIFSLLFGAGILIFTDNARAKGKNHALLHYRRMGWLLLFGLLHGYLLWYGDILVTYSLCGMLLLLFRQLSPRKLFLIGFGFYLVPLILDTFFASTMAYWPEEALESTIQSWMPDQKHLQHILEGYRGRWVDQMGVRVPATLFLETRWFMMQTFWRVMSMMLLGMSLYKWNILSAGQSTGYYIRMTLTGLGMGYFLSGLGVFLNFQNQWSMEFSMFLGTHFNYVGSVAVALGYTGLVMLICKSAGGSVLKRVFASVGRMAFSNYILQTILCTFIFYGHGLGLFGQVERSQQILLVVVIWIILMVISPIWLKRFRFGPLEWLWRSLFYMRWQPFLK